MVRASGRFPGKYYIDLSGDYRTVDIAQALGLSKETVEQKYAQHEAAWEESLGVWFFASKASAEKAMKDLGGKKAGRSLFLTYDEIDYIRQALINEGSNVISVHNDLKHRIFEKFNG